MAKLSPEDIQRIKDNWGTIKIPKGETKRAKEIHKNACKYVDSQVKTITESLKTWYKFHPNATREEVTERLEFQELAIETITKEKLNKSRLDAEKWDWRDRVDVGPVLNQGLACNTCWAFAAISAAQASLQKNFQDSQNMAHYSITDEGELLGVLGPAIFIEGEPSPFVQDLLNCMPIPKEEVCLTGWHGDAFDFMVRGKGIPMTYADGYTETNSETGEVKTYRREYVRGEKFDVEPNCGFIKADAWDYVNSPPDKLPTVEQLKTALIAHGPLVAPIFYDNNLRDYKGGVFKGRNMKKINHDVLLIGWDDSKKAWLVKNSWGEEWGEKGFAWIKYGANNIGVFAAWIEARKF